MQTRIGTIVTRLSASVLTLCAATVCGDHHMDGTTTPPGAPALPPSSQQLAHAAPAAHQFDATVGLEFLYWTAHQDGLVAPRVVVDHAVPGATASGPGTPLSWAKSVTEGSLKRKWSPGFKVSLGAFVGDGWRLSANYQWFRTTRKGSGTIKEGSVGTLATLPIVGGRYNGDIRVKPTASAELSPHRGAWAIGDRWSREWKLKAHHLVDLSFDRPIHLTPSLQLCPAFGFKVGYTKQTYSSSVGFDTTKAITTGSANNAFGWVTDADGKIAVPDQTEPETVQGQTYKREVTYKNKAFGPCVGLGVTWKPVEMLSVYGKVGFSGMYVTADKATLKGTLIKDTPAAGATAAKTEEVKFGTAENNLGKAQYFSPIVDVELGVGVHCITDQDLDLSLTLGWAAQHLIGWTRTANGSQKTLSLGGPKVGAQLLF